MAVIIGTATTMEAFIFKTHLKSFFLSSKVSATTTTTTTFNVTMTGGGDGGGGDGVVARKRDSCQFFALAVDVVVDIAGASAIVIVVASVAVVVGVSISLRRRRRVARVFIFSSAPLFRHRMTSSSSWIVEDSHRRGDGARPVARAVRATYTGEKRKKKKEFKNVV